MQEGTAADKDLRADGQLGKLVAHYVRTSNANYHEIDQRLKGGRDNSNRGARAHIVRTVTSGSVHLVSVHACDSPS